MSSRSSSCAKSRYFKRIGSVVSCNVLKDKRTKSPGAFEEAFKRYSMEL